jgi:hypothetical protein
MKATLPANTLGATGLLHLQIYGLLQGTGSIYYIDVGMGNATTTAVIDQVNAGNITAPVFFDYYLNGNGATNAQKAVLETYVASSTSGTGTFRYGYKFLGSIGTSTPAYDTTQAQTLYVIVKTVDTAGGMSFDNAFITLMR